MLGDVSFTSKDQTQWILSHANTLEELILDDAMKCVAVETGVFEVDVASRTVMRERDYLTDSNDHRPRFCDRPYESKMWFDETRWHHMFRQFQEGLPRLRHFAINHSHCDSQAFERADTLHNGLKEERYAIFRQSYWMSFAEYWALTYVFKEWEEDEKDQLQLKKPECDEKDQQALNELLDELKRRRRRRRTKADSP